MTGLKKRLKAFATLNLDLFKAPSILPPAPATLYTRIREEANRKLVTPAHEFKAPATSVLPEISELYRLFDEYNWFYFNGKLPRVRIEYSTRMSSAGSYTPSLKLIRIGRKYHEIFPEDLTDTLKHEMIHLIHLNHDKEFKAEALRIGTSIKAKAHPALQKPPRFVYECPACLREYPRQKRLRMSSCGNCAPKSYDGRFKLRLRKAV
jgi:predicted SprT family Zn-dependent metalloprotease